MIPRSTSVVVKRMPPARPGKGKAAMYIAAPGTSATPESKPNSQPAGSSWPSRGSLSRRFDKEVSSKPAAVRVFSLVLSILSFCPYAFDFTQTPVQGLVGKDDEVAAMAAMFQAQSANWEETQEKMSQLVSPLAVLLVSCSNFSNTHSLSALSRAVLLSLPPPFSLSVRAGFTPIHVERV